MSQTIAHLKQVFPLTTKLHVARSRPAAEKFIRESTRYTSEGLIANPMVAAPEQDMLLDPPWAVYDWS